MGTSQVWTHHRNPGWNECTWIVRDIFSVESVEVSTGRHEVRGQTHVLFQAVLQATHSCTLRWAELVAHMMHPAVRITRAPHRALHARRQMLALKHPPGGALTSMPQNAARALLMVLCTIIGENKWWEGRGCRWHPDPFLLIQLSDSRRPRLRGIIKKLCMRFSIP